MTKKDYEKIAKVIREFEPPFCDRNETVSDDEIQTRETRATLAVAFAEMLFADNPNFNTEKFMRACGAIS